jgi:hypothetical protein
MASSFDYTVGQAFFRDADIPVEERAVDRTELYIADGGTYAAGRVEV